MHALDELTASLTPAEVKDVEAYARSLAARHGNGETADVAAAAAAERPNRIQLDALDSMLTRMTDDMDWPEIKKRLRNEFADAAED